VKDKAFKLPPPFRESAQDQPAIDDALSPTPMRTACCASGSTGVLVYEQTKLKIRGEDRIRIQDLPFFNYYHGGSGFPKAAVPRRFWRPVRRDRIYRPSKHARTTKGSGAGVEADARLARRVDANRGRGPS
jgi:hypothetical protein